MYSIDNKRARILVSKYVFFVSNIEFANEYARKNTYLTTTAFRTSHLFWVADFDLDDFRTIYCKQ